MSIKITTRFNPKLYELLSGYSLQRFVRDGVAGITVAVVALPLAMAFAIASGLSPQAGIFTSIIGGFLISLFSGSRVQIGGPAGAFIVIVYGVVVEYGVDGLLLATFMSGVWLWLMGTLRLGVLIEFIPVAVIIGFTNGIAVLIALTQMRDTFGLRLDGAMPADFFSMISTLYRAMPTINYWALALTLLTLALIVLWQVILPRILRRRRRFRILFRLIPGSVVGLLLMTFLVALFNIPVETIGDRFGGIPQQLPQWRVPELSLARIRDLLIPSLTLAVLGAIESLLCARIADRMIHDEHDSNQELLSQGFANMVVAFFSGMPATGTIARTVTNIKNGGSSPVAGMVHAVVLLLIIWFAAPYAGHIPLAVLAAILLFVAWNMGQWQEFKRLRHYRASYRCVLLGVFLLTVMVDLTWAVGLGVIFACMTLIYRISTLSKLEVLPLTEEDRANGVRAYRMIGALFFGAVHMLKPLNEDEQMRVLVLDFSGMIYIDSSGEEALQLMLDRCRERAVIIYVCGLHPQPSDILMRTQWLHHLGSEYLCPNLETALARAVDEAAHSKAEV